MLLFLPYRHNLKEYERGEAGVFAWCAQYDLHSRGESPPWTVMAGTIRLGKCAFKLLRQECPPRGGIRRA